MAETEKRQPSGINARAVLWAGIAVVAGILLAAAASYLLWRWWSAPDAGRTPAFAPPQLDAAPQERRAQYFAEKRKLLESWEWIDRQKGIARIPIEQAMRAMAAQGGDADPARREQE